MASTSIAYLSSPPAFELRVWVAEAPNEEELASVVEAPDEEGIPIRSYLILSYLILNEEELGSLKRQMRKAFHPKLTPFMNSTR